MSIDKWMDKENVVFINNGILVSHKNERNPTICNMNETRRLYAKWNKPDRERQILYYLT